MAPDADSADRDRAPAAAAGPAPGKIIAVGRNYHEHAAEEGQTAPADPILFTKFPNALVGDGADIVWRAADTGQVDYEAELAVVDRPAGARRPASSGRSTTSSATPACNDVSARDLQFGDGQWVRGKSLDTFCPLGPWIVTADEIPDPGALRIRCLVNGEVVQDAIDGGRWSTASPSSSPSARGS